jgi:heme O synthase-like polyprenyltransferase
MSGIWTPFSLSTWVITIELANDYYERIIALLPVIQENELCEAKIMSEWVVVVKRHVSNSALLWREQVTFCQLSHDENR